VPILLDLSGQGAGAPAPQVPVQHATHPSGGRQREAPPLDGRVAIGVLPIEKIAILDEPEGVDQNGGDLLEAFISGCRIGRRLERLAPAIVQHDSGLELLVVDRVATRPDEVQQIGRLAWPASPRRSCGSSAAESGMAERHSQDADRKARTLESVWPDIGPASALNVMSVTAPHTNSDCR